MSRTARAVGVIGLSLGLVLPALATAACPIPTHPADLTQEVSLSEAAFRDLNETGVHEATAQIAAMLSCLDAAVSPELASAVLQERGLDLWLSDDKDGARAAFQAAVTASPTSDLPADLVPAVHPLRALYAEARVTPLPEIQKMDPGQGETLLVNGAPAPGLPVGVASLVQVRAADGRVRWSGLLLPGEPVPAEAGLAAPATRVPGTDAGPDVSPRHPRFGLLLGAGGAALGGGALYALSAVSAHAFQTPGRVDDDLNALAGVRRTNHAEVLGAAGLGAVALGLGVGSFLSGRF